MTSSATERLAPVIEDAVTVDGVRSPYLHAGPADAGEVVVFVHGNPGPAEDWRRLVARTGVFARAVAPDLPGSVVRTNPMVSTTPSTVTPATSVGSSTSSASTAFTWCYTTSAAAGA